MIRIAICDQDPGRIASLQSCIECYSALNKDGAFLIHCFSTPFDLLEYIEKNASFDALFMYTDMPGFSAEDVANELKKRREGCLFVFLSDTDLHALTAIEVGAVYYLIAPYEQAKVDVALSRLISALSHGNELYIIKKTARGMRKLYLADILYIEAEEHSQLVHLPSEVVTTRLSIMEYRRELEGDPRFARPHNSYIVNMQKIKQVLVKEVVMENGDVVPLSKRFAKSFKDGYARFIASPVPKDKEE